MANGLGIERGRTVQASVNTGASNPYEAYQQMADTLKEADTDLSGSKVSAYEKSEALGGDDDSDNKTSTVTYYDDDKKESNTISIKNEDAVVPLKDKKGKTIGAVDISKGAVDLYAKDEGLYKGLDISFSDKDFGVPIGGLTYEDTPSGRGLTYKLGKGKIYTDADADLLDFENTPIKVNAGFVLDFAEGGFVPDTKPMQMEMDLILSETKDPVSGNTAPLGATPEEVRDDVPINASPNEFMINAATRRYYGTDFFEELQKSAAEGWERIKQGEESYFRDDELEVEDDEKGQDKPRVNMQEGGPVPQPTGGGFGGYGGAGPMFLGFESKTFINDTTDQEMIIFFFNGRPMSRIPEGFREKEVTAVEEQAQQEVQRDDDDDPVITGQDSWRNKNPSDYTLDDYEAYASFYKRKGKNPLKMSNLEKGILSIAGDSLLGRLLGSGGGDALIKKTQEGIVKKASMINNSVNSILKSGVDNQGNKLTDDSNRTLFQAQYNANLISATSDPTGQTTGTPIFEQASYQQGYDDDDGGKYTGPDGKQYNSFHDYVTTSGTSTLNVDALLPPTGGTSIDITAEEQAAADRIMAGEGTQADYDKVSGDDKDENKDSSCVIATHGISTGGFSRLDKAKAELWCERTYHGKWYGEAFRRGYRHAGNIAIEKGKAAEHYQEFKDFVSYGRGLKKGVKPALNYYLRTAQFFLTGLFVK